MTTQNEAVDPRGLRPRAKQIFFQTAPARWPRTWALALAWALSLPLLGLCASPAHAKRVALIIGNAQYQNEKPLKNPINDARALARTLKEDLQFDDVVERSNVTRRELGRLIDQLGQRAQGADAVVVYYSGHGMQGTGGNYLIPVDAQITSNEDIKLEGVAANDVVDVLNQSGARVALLVLDACRDNPFRTRTKSSSKGLARMNVSGGNLLVAYATQEGDTADDGLGNNSPYALALIQHLKRKDLRVLEVFDEVAQQVKASTAQKQRPTRYGDLPVNVFLTGAPTQVASIDSVPARPGPRSPTSVAANFGDLEQAQREEAAARQQWADWQARMKADFNKAAAFSGNAELEAKAWARFLAAYAQDNPYSSEDEQLRAEASRKQVAAQAQVTNAASAVQANAGGNTLRAADAVFKDWDDAKLQIARRIVAANPEGSYLGKVPDLLLAIPVLTIELAADGSVQDIQVLRTPSNAIDTVELAKAAILRAAPFGGVSHLPRPWKLSEAFLFNSERKFKPMTLDRQ